MKKIIIVGAGGSTKVILDLFQKERWLVKIAGILDDDSRKTGTRFHGVPIVGVTDDLEKFKRRFDEVLIGVGAVKDTVGRNRLFENITKRGFKLFCFVSKQSLIAPTAKLGAGCILMPSVVVNASVICEDNVFLNTGTIVEHDCRVGRSSFLSPGCVISGATKIGRNTFLGSGTISCGSLKIGDHVTIGAGSVIVRNIPDGVICYGNPAHRNMRKK
jgi:UDP-perosamine 4-acetyltransferase